MRCASLANGQTQNPYQPEAPLNIAVSETNHASNRIPGALPLATMNMAVGQMELRQGGSGKQVPHWEICFSHWSLKPGGRHIFAGGVNYREVCARWACTQKMAGTHWVTRFLWLQTIDPKGAAK